jgi:predicted HicB family RNase H-like nuclease
VKQIAPMGLRMPEDMKTWLAEQAKKERRSMNSYVLLLIEKAMGGKHAAS